VQKGGQAMNGRMLSLSQAAEHVHVEANELRHFAQRGEIEAVKRGDDWLFDHRTLDEWAQRNLLSSSERDLAAQHRAMMDEDRRHERGGWGVAGLFRAEAMDLALTAKAKAGMIRDMTDLAGRSGFVYDEEWLFQALMEREEAASTAIGQGVALLHPRFHDPYVFAESFVAYGRGSRQVFFGAPDGEGTRHFFLICAVDHSEHLHILARLAMLAHGTDLIERLDAAEDAESVIAAVGECEKEYRN
jgi:mannitol/fructose-specific phosphotransferase system IIA component (Ntr-type)